MIGVTKHVDEGWNIPGSDITIWTITFEHDGATTMHKTMSQNIAVVGFQGELEEYTNDKGNAYVRQIKRDDAPPAAQSAERPDRYKQDPEKADGIMRMNALNNAVASRLEGERLGATLDTADIYYDWLKNEPKAGYDKAKETAEALRPNQTAVETNTDEEAPPPEYQGEEEEPNFMDGELTAENFLS